MQPIGRVLIDIEGVDLTGEDREKINHPNTGGIILFSRNFECPKQISDLIKRIRRSRNGPLLVAVDQEGGRVQRFKQGFTALPPACRYAQDFPIHPIQALHSAKLAGWLLATELISVGIDFSFAPVLDVDSGISAIIADRSFSRDPKIVCEIAQAFRQGVREAGMASVGKHFPGHGGVSRDSHLALPKDPRPYQALLERDLLPFLELIRCGLEAIMPAHIVYPQIDDFPAGFSKVWLKKILREELRFEGAIFSDDLNMEGAAFGGDFRGRAELALQAGCDMVLVCNNPKEAVYVLEELTPANQQPARTERLARMRAEQLIDFSSLTQHPTWNEAKEQLGRLNA